MKLSLVKSLVGYRRIIEESGLSADEKQALVGGLLPSPIVISEDITAKYPTLAAALKFIAQAVEAEIHSEEQRQTVLLALLKLLSVKALASPIRVVVFVHGIFSTSQAAFQEMYQDFSATLEHFLFVLHDYNFHEDLVKNGKSLADSIAGSISSCEVTLVCHSMGGLVGRLAVLSGAAKCIQRLIMIGTPNFGALRTAQLGLLSQLALQATGQLYAIFRKPGLRQLTQISTVFQDLVESSSSNSDSVEYVTIPGAFFNESRRVWEIGEWGDWQLWKVGFAGLNLTSELLTALLPLWKVGLEKPHDGIVEIRSNKLLPNGPGHSSEKSAVIDYPDRFGSTYIHIEPSVSGRLTHVMIQHNAEIVVLIRSIIASATVTSWFDSLDKDAVRRLHIEFPK